jgi:beta-galactosidase GanA
MHLDTSDNYSACDTCTRLKPLASGLHLAVDYYPSQWPEWMWQSDVARMRGSNIPFV